MRKVKTGENEEIGLKMDLQANTKILLKTISQSKPKNEKRYGHFQEDNDSEKLPRLLDLSASEKNFDEQPNLDDVEEDSSFQPIRQSQECNVLITPAQR